MTASMICLMYVHRGVTDGVKPQTALSDKMIESPDTYGQLTNDGFHNAKHKYTKVVSAMKMSIPNIVIKVRSANTESIL